MSYPSSFNICGVPRKEYKYLPLSRLLIDLQAGKTSVLRQEPNVEDSLVSLKLGRTLLALKKALRYCPTDTLHVEAALVQGNRQLGGVIIYRAAPILPLLLRTDVRLRAGARVVAVCGLSGKPCCCCGIENKKQIASFFTNSPSFRCCHAALKSRECAFWNRALLRHSNAGQKADEPKRDSLNVVLKFRTNFSTNFVRALSILLRYLSAA